MLHEIPSNPKPQKPRSVYYRIGTNLTFWVILAITGGILIGVYFPTFGFNVADSMDLHYKSSSGELVKDPNIWEFFSLKFITIIKIFIPPIIFLTIVLGISGMGDMKKVGRIGIKALIYFEVVTTLALIIGVSLAYWLEPGSLNAADNAEMRATLAKEAAKVGKTVEQSKEGFSFLKFFLDNITIQVLVAAILAGIALNFSRFREKVVHYLEIASKYVFMVLKYVMYLAPVAALSGMAFTISKYGLKTLVPLAKLMGTVYATMGLFIFLVLGGILWIYRIKIWHVLKYIKEELLIVLGDVIF